MIAIGLGSQTPHGSISSTSSAPSFLALFTALLNMTPSTVCGRGPLQSRETRAGFHLRGNGAPNALAPGEELVPWPHDCLRHSFGSYHLAHFKDAARTALEMGHKSTIMLFSNYWARVSEKDAVGGGNAVGRMAMSFREKPDGVNAFVTLNANYLSYKGFSFVRMTPNGYNMPLPRPTLLRATYR